MIDAGAPHISANIVSLDDLHRPAIIETASPMYGASALHATMAPRREPHFAEREELDAALAKGTLEALLLFIERHPQSRYRLEAEKALRERGVSPSTR